ncbi:c-type cytochrome [Neobacillus sp. NRS-1170]|uniref:c-type cytochrome n=1 Tax=Neobacillus sp. NRS-1170 TaxID=3233898 RepID=UPI003D2BDA9C
MKTVLITLAILVIGIGGFFILSNVQDQREVAKETPGQNEAKEPPAQNEGQKEGGAVSKVDGESIYKTTCAGCHGDQYQGGVGPSLKGVGSRLSEKEIENIVQHGRGNMPSGLVSKEDAPGMAAWLKTLK